MDFAVSETIILFLCTFDLNSTLPCIQRGEMSVPIIVAVAAVVVPLAAVGVLPPPFL